MKVNPVFDKIVGQQTAKVRLSESIASAAHDGPMLSPLIIADKGVGKSCISKAAIEGYKALKMDTLVFNSPEEFRLQGEAYASLEYILRHSRKYAIFIDECHLFKNRPTVQSEKVFAFLMKALDKQNHNTAIRFSDDIVLDFNRKKACFILATNFPNLLDKSGAFQSRCDLMVLEHYSEFQLIDILQNMLKEKGFRECNEATLRMIARCGRGTARPMEKIVDQLLMSHEASGKKVNSINRDDVIHALRISQMYPRGLEPFEVEILQRTDSAIRDNVLLPFMPQLEKSQWNRSKGYLLGCEFMAVTSKGIQRTNLGTKYLENIQKDGFKLPK